MAESSNTGKKISKNDGLKRSSNDGRGENAPKQQRRENIPLPVVTGSNLPVAETSAFGASKSLNQTFVKNSLVFTREQAFLGGSSAVDAAKCGSGFDDAVLGARAKGKLPAPPLFPPKEKPPVTPVINWKGMVPELSTTSSLQGKSCGYFNGMNYSIGSGTSAGSLERTVLIIRKLETEKYVTDEFRMKFLTWYGLKASEKERGVVESFIQTLEGDPSCLAAQLIDSFSDIIFKKP